MWIVAPLERNEGGQLGFTDHAAIDLYRTEAKAREASLWISGMLVCRQISRNYAKHITNGIA